MGILLACIVYVTICAETLLNEGTVGLHVDGLQGTLQLIHPYLVLSNVHITANDMRQQGKASVRVQVTIPSIQVLPGGIVGLLCATLVL